MNATGRSSQTTTPSPARFRRFAVAVLALAAALGLSGCGVLYDTDGLLQDAQFWQDADGQADAALVALAKGEYPAAEIHVERALKAEPDHPFGLLAAGILYQNTGRPGLARQAYERLIVIRAAQTATVGSWTSLRPTTLGQIAATNLQLLEPPAPIATIPAPGLPITGVAPVATPPSAAAPPAIAGPVPLVPPLPDRTAPPAMVLPQTAVERPLGADSPVVDVGDRNVLRRFEALERLRQEGLITEDEYAARRAANVGGLLPLTKPPPALGVDRPVPNVEQVVTRLRALREALENRGITPQQHATERTVILDALLPAAPAFRDNPKPRPQDMMAAAAAAGRLADVRGRGLVNDEEYQAEERALAAIMRQVAGRSGTVPGVLVPGSARRGASAARSGGAGNFMVHLASYKTREGAEAGLAELRQKFASQLSGLAPNISQVDLGATGTFFRLNLGPMGSRDAADALCARLQAQGQYCRPTLG